MKPTRRSAGDPSRLNRVAFAPLIVALRSEYTRYSSLTRLVSRAPHWPRRSRGFHHRLFTASLRAARRCVSVEIHQVFLPHAPCQPGASPPPGELASALTRVSPPAGTEAVARTPDVPPRTDSPQPCRVGRPPARPARRASLGEQGLATFAGRPRTGGACVTTLPGSPPEVRARRSLVPAANARRTAFGVVGVRSRNPAPGGPVAVARFDLSPVARLPMPFDTTHGKRRIDGMCESLRHA